MEVHATQLSYKDYKTMETMFPDAEERTISDEPYGYYKYLTIHLLESETVLVFTGPYKNTEEAE